MYSNVCPALSLPRAKREETKDALVVVKVTGEKDSVFKIYDPASLFSLLMRSVICHTTFFIWQSFI